MAGSQLLSRVKEIVAEGNVRRLVIGRMNGDLLLEVPLTAGALLGGALTLAYPFLTALLAIGGIVARVKIEIVRVDGGPKE